jgi:hypothetical protein
LGHQLGLLLRLRGLVGLDFLGGVELLHGADEEGSLLCVAAHDELDLRRQLELQLLHDGLRQAGHQLLGDDAREQTLHPVLEGLHLQQVADLVVHRDGARAARRLLQELAHVEVGDVDLQTEVGRLLVDHRGHRRDAHVVEARRDRGAQVAADLGRQLLVVHQPHDQTLRHGAQHRRVPRDLGPHDVLQHVLNKRSHGDKWREANYQRTHN